MSALNLNRIEECNGDERWVQQSLGRRFANPLTAHAEFDADALVIDLIPKELVDQNNIQKLQTPALGSKRYRRTGWILMAKAIE
jgi:hypothetical protein